MWFIKHLFGPLLLMIGSAALYLVYDWSIGEVLLVLLLLFGYEMQLSEGGTRGRNK